MRGHPASPRRRPGAWAGSTWARPVPGAFPRPGASGPRTGAGGRTGEITWSMALVVALRERASSARSRASRTWRTGKGLPGVATGARDRRIRGFGHEVDVVVHPTTRAGLESGPQDPCRRRPGAAGRSGPGSGGPRARGEIGDSGRSSSTKWPCAVAELHQHGPALLPEQRWTSDRGAGPELRRARQAAVPTPSARVGEDFRDSGGGWCPSSPASGSARTWSAAWPGSSASGARSHWDVRGHRMGQPVPVRLGHG